MTSPLASLAIQPGLRAVVTAGAAGIGRAIADALLANGAKVLICDVDRAALDEFRAAHPGAGATFADVADEADMERLFGEARAMLGGLDLLVNNAGIAGPTGAVEDIAPADWRRCSHRPGAGSSRCAPRGAPPPAPARRRSRRVAAPGTMHCGSTPRDGRPHRRQPSVAPFRLAPSLAIERRGVRRVNRRRCGSARPVAKCARVQGEHRS